MAAFIALSEARGSPTEQDVKNVPSIRNFYNLDLGLDLEGPGTREFFVDVTADRTFIWPFYWCATDRDILAENLKSLGVGFFIDSVQVPTTDILEYEHESERWACHYWATKLSDWEEGEQILLMVRYSFRRTVNDGRKEYRAGDYYYRLIADVRSR